MGCRGKFRDLKYQIPDNRDIDIEGVCGGHDDDAYIVSEHSWFAVLHLELSEQLP